LSFHDRGVPLVQAGSDLVRGVGATLSRLASDDGTRCDEPGDTGDSEPFPQLHGG